MPEKGLELEVKGDMARRTFFSFCYKPDVSRAWVVRNSWVTKDDTEDAGFFDSSTFESKKRESEDVLKRFLREAINGTSVTCVLYGTQTASRRWVRYELVRSFIHGSGLLAVDIHLIQDFDQKTAALGMNPFDCLAFRVDGERLDFYEMQIESGKQVWHEYTDAPGMALPDVVYDLGDKKYHTFSTLFSHHDWDSGKGRENIGNWIEAAAKKAGR